MVSKIPQHYFANFLLYINPKPYHKEFYTKHWELLPTCVVPIFTTALCMAQCIRCLWVSELIWTRQTKTHDQDLDMLIHPRSTKLMHVSQVLEPNQEMYDILKGMRDREKEEEAGETTGKKKREKRDSKPCS